MATGNSTNSKSDYAKRYRATPRGAAACAWNRLTSRAGGKYNFGRCYLHVEVRMTRDEFIAWAIPKYEAWFRNHPGITPSIDRIDNNGHYELTNIQMISNRDNTLKNSHQKNIHAPPGTRWCCDCRDYKPTDDFYRGKVRITDFNPLGLFDYCKRCFTAKSSEYRRRRKKKL